MQINNMELIIIKNAIAVTILKQAYTQKLKVQHIEFMLQEQRKINKESRAKIIKLSDEHQKEQNKLIEMIKI